MEGIKRRSAEREAQGEGQGREARGKTQGRERGGQTQRGRIRV